jgi:hypothetical protein
MAPVVVHAQENTGIGLVTAVDVARNTLMLATRIGSKEVLVAPPLRSARIMAELAEDIRPGDAVAYQILWLCHQPSCGTTVLGHTSGTVGTCRRDHLLDAAAHPNHWRLT